MLFIKKKKKRQEDQLETIQATEIHLKWWERRELEQPQWDRRGEWKWKMAESRIRHTGYLDRRVEEGVVGNGEGKGSIKNSVFWLDWLDELW